MSDTDKKTVDEQIQLAYERVCKLSSPRAVQALPREEIVPLCRDLRRVLIDRTRKNGGHLASNLGVVELTVAIHRVFNAPVDHIIFDVGHQCYVHKLLTGRALQFDTLRRPGGLSGFPSRSESEYDAFGTGHASTSLSAALGLARADRLSGSEAYTVVVLGDGALTGGMVHEALNNCEKDLKLIVILNENEMSISKNVGHFANLLTRLRAAPSYSRTKKTIGKTLEHLPLIGEPVRRASVAVKNGLKSVLYSSNYFESMGLNYFGAADGNDEEMVEQLLRAAKIKGSCSLVHLKTVKGKGFESAERDPSTYHGISPAPVGAAATPTFSDTFGQTLTALAEQNDTLCAITAAMPQGTGLVPFAAAYPSRFFDVGIAEEHAVTFAAGLAAGGMRPVVAVYSTFLQRAYDQIVHDVALQKLPVLFAIDRAGLNAADGPTHHGVLDVSFLSHIPGISLWEPATTAELSRLLTRFVHADIGGPVAIRYPSGRDDARIVSYLSRAHEIDEGIFADFTEESAPSVIVLTYGRLCASVLDAAGMTDARIGVLLLERLNDFDATVALLTRLCDGGVKRIVVCEEGMKNGGIGMNLSTRLYETMPKQALPEIRLLAIDQEFVHGASDQSIQQSAHLGTEDILKALTE